MAARAATWVRRRPLLAFYILAFAITWLGWLPQAAHSHGLSPFQSPLLYLLGGVGPMAAAFIVLHLSRGKGAYEELLSPLLRWRVGIAWYLVALFGHVAIWLAAIGLSAELGPELEKAEPSLVLLPAFLIRLLTAVPEEVGWRGFALPRLQSRHSALVSSLIVGVLWALWHLPLLLTNGNVMSTYAVVPYFLEVIAIAVVYTWLYNSTRGSLLVVTIFHAASNMVGPFVGAEQTAVALLLAAVIVIALGPAHLSRRAKQPAPYLGANALAMDAGEGKAP